MEQMRHIEYTRPRCTVMNTYDRTDDIGEAMLNIHQGFIIVNQMMSHNLNNETTYDTNEFTVYNKHNRAVHYTKNNTRKHK